jgi:uncharacterized membrane protein YdjX (TVP38/TMEM64 family)
VSEEKRTQLLIKGAILLLLVGLIFLLSRFGPQPFFLEPLWHELEEIGGIEDIPSKKEKLKAFLVSLGPYSSAVFVLLQALQVIASPFPGEVTGVVGGFVYGKAFGFLLSMLGLALGSWVAFEIARILEHRVERFVRKDILEKFRFLTTNTGVTICFLLFLFPGFPKDYLCYVLGLSPMKLSTFLIVSTIGRMPGTYLLTVQGASIRNQHYMTAIVFGLTAAILLFVAYIYREHLFHWIRKSVRDPS